MPESESARAARVTPSSAEPPVNATRVTPWTPTATATSHLATTPALLAVVQTPTTAFPARAPRSFPSAPASVLRATTWTTPEPASPATTNAVLVTLEPPRAA